MLDDAPIGEHGLDAGDLRAGHAVCDDADSAGIGRDGAANGGGVTRGEIDAVLPSATSDVAMEVTEGDTRADSHLAAHIVDRIKAREAARGEDDGERTCLVTGHRSADEPGVATLRDHRDARFGAGRHDSRDLGRAPGTDDGQCRSAPATTPVGGEGLDEGRISEAMVRAYDVSKSLQEIAHVDILPDGTTARCCGLPDIGKHRLAPLCEDRCSPLRGPSSPTRTTRHQVME